MPTGLLQYSGVPNAANTVPQQYWGTLGAGVGSVAEDQETRVTQEALPETRGCRSDAGSAASSASRFVESDVWSLASRALLRNIQPRRHSKIQGGSPDDATLLDPIG
ncbi:MAG: hypothetical protein QNJ15_10125 [Erythrobacter sp.]|nr:hypothetical protein [Erythrobacter sp.]